MPEEVQREAGCVIGEDYPEPIVDHAGGAPRGARALPSLGRRPGALKLRSPFVDTGRMSIEMKNGLPESVRSPLTLELTLAEAEALKAWLLKPAADGSAAIEDENAKSVMVQAGLQARLHQRCEGSRGA